VVERFASGQLETFGFRGRGAFGLTSLR